MPVVVDSTVLYSLVDRRDERHDAARTAIAAERSVVVVPQAVVPEVAYLVRRRAGADAEADFLDALARSAWRLEPLLDADHGRCAELARRYADLPLGFVDAAVVTVAERLGVARIYTFDHDFTVVRPRHRDAFEVLPG